MLNVKAGQTYVCIKSGRPWWTEGKEYNVVCNSYGKLVMIDNDGDERSLADLDVYYNQFKLKEEKTPSSKLDLNKLTLEELKEYVTIMKTYNLAELELCNFIERVTK